MTIIEAIGAAIASRLTSDERQELDDLLTDRAEDLLAKALGDDVRKLFAAGRQMRHIGIGGGFSESFRGPE